MYFKYQVEQTKPFSFNPTQLEIYIGSRETIPAVLDDNGVEITPAQEVINVQTVLTETLQNLPNYATGTLTETKQHKLPASVLDAITGFDKTTMQVVVDPAGLNQILAAFNLQLA